MTQRLPPLDLPAMNPFACSALQESEAWLGVGSTVLRTMANSSAALLGYFALDSALSNATLDPRLRKQIALAVAEVNACGQCVQAHSVSGHALGLDETAIRSARYAASPDPKVEAALQFAQKVAEYRADLTDDEFGRIRRAGYSDEEIAEIIANVVLCIYANYFNLIAQPSQPCPCDESENS